MYILVKDTDDHMLHLLHVDEVCYEDGIIYINDNYMLKGVFQRSISENEYVTLLRELFDKQKLDLSNSDIFLEVEDLF